MVRFLIPVLASLLAAEAGAKCMFHTFSKNGESTSPLAFKSSDKGTETYEASADGFSAQVKFDSWSKKLWGQVLGPEGEQYQADTIHAEMLEQLDCSSGFTGENGYQFTCDSPEWREKQKQSGGPIACENPAMKPKVTQ